MMGKRYHSWAEHDAVCKTCRRYVGHTPKYCRWAKRSVSKRERREGKREARSAD